MPRREYLNEFRRFGGTVYNKKSRCKSIAYAWRRERNRHPTLPHGSPAFADVEEHKEREEQYSIFAQFCSFMLAFVDLCNQCDYLGLD